MELSRINNGSISSGEDNSSSHSKYELGTKPQHQKALKNKSSALLKNEPKTGKTLKLDHIQINVRVF